MINEQIDRALYRKEDGSWMFGNKHKVKLFKGLNGGWMTKLGYELSTFKLTAESSTKSTTIVSYSWNKCLNKQIKIIWKLLWVVRNEALPTEKLHVLKQCKSNVMLKTSSRRAWSMFVPLKTLSWPASRWA